MRRSCRLRSRIARVTTPVGKGGSVRQWLHAARAKIGVLGASGYTGSERCGCCCAIRRSKSRCSQPTVAPGRRCATCFRSSRRSCCPSWSRSRPSIGRRPGSIWCSARCRTRPRKRWCKELLAKAPRTKVVDLSADFRLADPAAYARWYGHEHHAPELQKEAVYGLVEVHRGAIKAARLVANPGCYTTCAQLPLVPLIKAKAIELGRDRGRRQVRHDRSGPGGQGEHAVLGSVRGLPRLWRRPSPPYGRARSGVLTRRRDAR